MRIGPSGNSRRFYEEGFTKSEQTPAWLKAQGLTAYEYSMGHGVRLTKETAQAIGAEAAKNDVQMSVHAPYFINCASHEPERREKSAIYILQAAQAADWLGAKRVVLHVGTPGRLDRNEALDLTRRTIAKALESLDAEGLSHIALCPETMGRPSQVGTLGEILSLCKAEDRLIPTLDFGHLHTISQGALSSVADFRDILTQMVDALGFERAKHFHIHFSHIEFGPKGEKRHVNFSDPGYGPDFHHLAPVLLEMGLEPVIICESAGDQADDALEMLRIVREFKAESLGNRDCEPESDMV
jgi:deoxyribonuclease-4